MINLSHNANLLVKNLMFVLIIMRESRTWFSNIKRSLVTNGCVRSWLPYAGQSGMDLMLVLIMKKKIVFVSFYSDLFTK